MVQSGAERDWTIRGGFRQSALYSDYPPQLFCVEQRVC